MNPNQLGPNHFLVPGGQSIQNIQKYRQQQLYQGQQSTRYETEEESSSDEEYEKTNVPLQKIQEPIKKLNRKRYLKDNLLIAYSGDKNVLGGETTFNYTINFNESQSGNSRASAFFNISLKNIRSISIIDVIMPNFYLDLPLLHGLANQFYYTPLGDNTSFTSNTKPAEHDDNIRIMRPPRLQDLPFILLKIQGLDGDMKGTNTDIDSSICMLTIEQVRSSTNNASGTYEVLNKVAPDSFKNFNNNPELKRVQKGNCGEHILADTDKNILYFKNKTKIQKNFFPNPLARLGALKIDFFDHLGNPLKFQHEYLEIDQLELITPGLALEGGPAPNPSSTGFLELTTKQLYSPDEYRVGDLLVFQNVQTNPRNISIESFLNRKEGHILLQHKIASRIKAGANSFENYFNKFYIFSQVKPELTIPYVDGSLAPLSDGLGSQITSFSYTSPEPHLEFASGICINQSLQHTISFNIKTEEHAYDTQDTELI